MANYKFPLTIDSKISPIVLFASFEWSLRGKKTQDITQIQQSVDSITLPIPDNGINDSNSQNWETGVGLNANSYLDSITKNVVGGAANLTGDLGKYYFTKHGTLLNDLAGLSYNGNDFRTFEFNYNVLPRNQQEAEILLNIINRFKYNSLAEYNDFTISYPNFWNIFVKFPNNKKYIKIKNCVVTNFTNSFFNDNKTIMKDGSPANYNFSISFMEMQKVDRRDYL